MAGITAKDLIKDLQDIVKKEGDLTVVKLNSGSIHAAHPRVAYGSHIGGSPYDSNTWAISDEPKPGLTKIVVLI